jgi:hypothetical protein
MAAPFLNRWTKSPVLVQVAMPLGYVVTLSVDQVTFKQPIHVSGSIAFLSSVNFRVKKHPWR